MKYVGLLLIVAAGIGLGLYASHRLSRRVALLCQLERVMESLLRLLTYSARPMGALWRQMAGMDHLSACPLVADTVAGMEQKPFSAAFEVAVERGVATGLLQPPEQQLLQNFGAECGQYDLSRQADQIRGCLAGLQEVRREAEERLRTRGAVCRMAGFAGGMALALLLL